MTVWEAIALHTTPEIKRAAGLGEAVAGLAMKENAPLCGLKRTYAASQQACDDTGQRVSRS